MKKTALTIALLVVGTVTASAQRDTYSAEEKTAATDTTCRAAVLKGVDEVECRAAMANFIIRIEEAAKAEHARREREARERVWAERCKPFKRRDANGIDRYEYAHPDCAGAVIAR